MRLWTWSAIVISVALCLVLSWLHFKQQEMVEHSRRLLSGFREARLELAQGFFQLTLSRGNTSPFSHEAGIALLKQASSTFKDNETEVDALTPTRNETKTATEFRAKLKQFQRQLKAYSDGPAAARRKLELPLRLAYYNLDQLAQRLDGISKNDLQTLAAGQHRRFDFALVSAMILMGLMCLAVYHVGQRENAAFQALRASEEKMKETNQFLTDLIEHSSAVIFVKDKAGQYALVNRKWEEVTGTKREQATGRTDQHLFPGAIGNQFLENDRRVLDSGQPLEVEEVVADPSGERTFLSVKFPIRADDGTVRGVCGMATDVTQRKQAELALKRQGALLANINRVLSLGLGRETEEEMCMACLEMVENITGSQMSFIGEIGADGMMHDLAVSSPTWKVCRMTDQTGHRKPPGNFRLHGILGQVLNNGQSHISNDPAHHPDRTGFPEGHPPLTAFLGVPLRREGKTIGMIAAGNRPGGYGKAEQHDLEALAPVILEALDRKRAEAALHEREAQLRLFVEHSPAALAMLDTNLKHLIVSRRWLADYRLGDQNIIGRSHYEVFPEIPERWKEIHRRCLAGAIESCEADPLQRADGSLDWVRWEIRPWHTARGDVGGIIIFSELITDRKQAEQALEASEKRHRTILEAAMDGYWRTSLDGRLLGANAAYCRMSGYTEAELLAMRIWDLEAHEPQPELVEAHIQKVMQGGGDIFETAHRRKDGTTLPLEISLQYMPEDGGCMVAFMRDITERKAAEAALRANEQKYRNLFENMAEEVHYWQLVRAADGRIQTWRLVDANPSALKSWNRQSIEEIRGKTTDEIFGPGATEHYRGVVEKIFAEGVPHSFEDYLPQLDRHFRFTSVPLGEYFITTGADVSHLLKTTAALLASEASLESFLNTAATGLVRNSRDLRYQSANAAYARLVNRSMDQIIGHSLAEVMGERALTKIQLHIDRVLAGERVEYESALPLPHNPQCWIHAVYTPDFGSAGEIVGWVGSITDITTRKQAEQLRSQLAAIVESSEDAIVGKDLNGIVTSWNHGAEKLFGYSAAEMIGQPVIKLFPAGREEEETEIIARIREGEVVKHFETVRLHKNGRCLDVSVTISPIHDASGQIVGASKIARDITARKRAEAEIHHQASLIKSLLDSIPDLIFYKDPQGMYLGSNPAFAEFIGRPREEITGKTDYELFPEDVANAFRAHDRKMQESLQSRRNEEWVSYPDGRRVLLDTLKTPFIGPDGHPLGVLGISRDITGRKQAEENLQNEKATLQGILNATLESVWLFDVDYRIRMANEIAVQRFGKTLDEAIGQHYAELVSPELAKTRIARLEKAIRLKQPLEFEDARDGMYFRNSLYPVSDTAGNVTGVVCYSREITETKRAEEKILELNRTLEHRVQERTAELRASNEELDAFVYAVSHDLRAPLRAMNGFSQALREDFAPQLPPEAGEYLDYIQEGSREMGGLIDGLLRLSRITRGELECQAVDISALATRLLDQLKRNEPARNVTCNIAPNLTANGDARLLEIVFTNLLGNAWKYSAANPQAVIRVCGQTNEHYATIAVADNGAGFDMKHAARLFQPFQRLHRDDEFPGIGIGLATVQRIVRRHGGQIQAEAAPGRGATFTLNLPIF